jgi:hypothetical protein
LAGWRRPPQCVQDQADVRGKTLCRGRFNASVGKTLGRESSRCQQKRAHLPGPAARSEATSVAGGGWCRWHTCQPASWRAREDMRGRILRATVAAEAAAAAETEAVGRRHGRSGGSGAAWGRACSSRHTSVSTDLQSLQPRIGSAIARALDRALRCSQI